MSYLTDSVKEKSCRIRILLGFLGRQQLHTLQSLLWRGAAQSAQCYTLEWGPFSFHFPNCSEEHGLCFASPFRRFAVSPFRRFAVSPCSLMSFHQDELSQDLLNFAAESLRDGGRLVFLAGRPVTAKSCQAMKNTIFTDILI